MQNTSTPDVRTDAARILHISQSRYRDWYRSREIILRPRRYGDIGVQWEAYLAEKEGPYALRADYPGSFIAAGPSRVAATEAAHDFLDLWDEMTADEAINAVCAEAERLAWVEVNK